MIDTVYTIFLRMEASSSTAINESNEMKAMEQGKESQATSTKQHP